MQLLTVEYEKVLGGDKDRPYVTVLGARGSRFR